MLLLTAAITIVLCSSCGGQVAQCYAGNLVAVQPAISLGSVPCVVLFGQSNAEGSNEGGFDIFGELRNYQRNVPFYYRSNGNYPNAARAAQYVAPLDTTKGGIEINLADTASGGSSMCLYRVAHGGTSLHVDWLKGSGSMYTMLTNEWGYATNRYYLDYGATPYITAFVWVHGESDATNATYANAYDTNLSNLITNVRGDFGTNALFITARLSSNIDTNTYPYWETVADAQSNSTNMHTYTSMQPLDSATLRDGVHFDDASLILVGQLLGSNYLENVN